MVPTKNTTVESLSAEEVYSLRMRVVVVAVGSFLVIFFTLALGMLYQQYKTQCSNQGGCLPVSSK